MAGILFHILPHQKPTSVLIQQLRLAKLDAVAESVERAPRVRDREFSSPSTKFDTCDFLVWLLALIAEGKDWLAQLWDNVTEWDIGWP